MVRSHTYTKHGIVCIHLLRLISALNKLTCFPGGMLQDHLASILKGTAVTP